MDCIFIMWPYFELLGRTIGSYQIMTLCGIFAAGIYSCKITQKTGYNDDETIFLLLFASMGVFIGGHLLYGIVNFSYIIYIINNLEIINSIPIILDNIIIIFGGSIFYGGLIGGLCTGYLYTNKKKERKYLIDIVTPAIPLFHFFGRIGCFLRGCCFGIESHFGFIYTHAVIEEANGVNRFPVQLFEAGFNIVLFFILSNIRHYGLIKNKLIFLYLLLYSIGRFILEFFRGDKYRGFFLFLSTSQIISIVSICFSIIKILQTGESKKSV